METKGLHWVSNVSGLANSFWTMIFFRSLSGALNGNVAVSSRNYRKVFNRDNGPLGGESSHWWYNRREQFHRGFCDVRTYLDDGLYDRVIAMFNNRESRWPHAFKQECHGRFAVSSFWKISQVVWLGISIPKLSISITFVYYVLVAF